MPYTPPAVQSPIVSKPRLPSLNQPQSWNGTAVQSNSTSQVKSSFVLPATQSPSRTYLHRHRRSPSITRSPPTQLDTQCDHPPQPRQEASISAHADKRDLRHTGVDDETGSASSAGTSSNSSDDEAHAASTRGRSLENLAELQEAIKSIEQKRSSSPTEQEEARKTRVALGLELPCGKPTDKAKTVVATLPQRPPLSAEARKISHSRSSTETSACLDFLPQKRESHSSAPPHDDFEVVDDIEIGRKPPLLRKKSGEPIRPALRPSSAPRRRPSSMPGTPTYGKAVHFDNHLEHVRTFLQVDRPLAVSAGSSPVETYESDSEFPFTNAPRAPRFEWQISLPNFPSQRPEKAGVPVRMEKIYLSADNKSLLGLVAVQNLAFHKLVLARFTFDHWQTTSEVKADYSNDARRRQLKDGFDRFVFNIKITEQAHLERKTMFICIRYSVNGQDFWDNNGSMNYQVDFSKQARLQNGKNGMQGAVARPLQGFPPSKPSPPTSVRPRSFPSVPDGFMNGVDKPFEFSAFPQPSARHTAESPMKLSKPETELVPHIPPRRPQGAGQAFGNRYDFGVSLSAAMQAATSALGDRSGLPLQPNANRGPAKQSSLSARPHFDPTPNVDPSSADNPGQRGSEDVERKTGMTPKTTADVSTPPPLTADQAPLQSSSYHELLDKYCFVRSGPTKIATMQC